MHKFKYLLAAALFASAAGAHANVVIASDSFGITSISKTNANSVKNDDGGDGWAGGWQTQATAANAPQIVSANMEGKTALQFTKNVDKAAFRLLAAPVSGDVLVDFLIQVSGAPQANTFLGLWFDNYNGPNIGLKTDCGGAVKKCTDDVFARTKGTAGPFMSGSALASGTTYHLFAHLYKSKPGASYDTFDVWLNPTETEMDTLTGWDLHTTGASGLMSFDTVGFRTSGLTTGVSVRVDALTLATIPESGTLSLMALAAVGLGVLRRPRRA